MEHDKPALVKDKDRKLAEIAKLYQHCQKCSLRAYASKPVVGSGSMELGLFVVGEAPGKVEDREGHNFIGPSGAILRRAIETITSAERVYYANSVCCFPGAEVKTPTESHVEACRPRLLFQLRTVQPRAILLVGKIAEGLIEGQPNPEYYELKDTSGMIPIRVFVVTHPSYLLRKGGEKSKDYAEFLSGVQRAIRFCQRRKAA